MLPDSVRPGRGAGAAADSHLAMGRGLLQHVANDLMQAVQPQDSHDSAHILSGASRSFSWYMG